MKRRFLLVSAMFATTAVAQNTQIGGLAGVGSFGAEDVSSRAYWIAGAEACILCGGRFALFVEYSHYGSDGKLVVPDMPRAKATRITSVDLVSGGLRVQRPRGRARPFFDIGISGGQDRYLSRGWAPTDGSHNLVGLALGGGVTIDVKKRWYVRPTVRAHVMSGLHVGGSLAVAAGYRF
jgi:hypothetical protein